MYRLDGRRMVAKCNACGWSFQSKHNGFDSLLMTGDGHAISIGQVLQYAHIRDRHAKKDRLVCGADDVHVVKYYDTLERMAGHIRKYHKKAEFDEVLKEIGR